MPNEREAGMPRPKTDPTYQRQVARLAEEGLKPPAIYERIAKKAAAEGRRDFPSERTVRRYFGEWMEQPEARRRQEAQFHWPASMEAGLLEWSASRAAL